MLKSDLVDQIGRLEVEAGILVEQNEIMVRERSAAIERASGAERAVSELNTKVLWLEHKLAQFKKAHAATVDGFLS